MVDNPYSNYSETGMNIVNPILDYMQNRSQNKLAAKDYKNQSILYGMQADMYATAAKGYASGARAYKNVAQSYIKAGKGNAKNERIRAGQFDAFEQFQLMEALQERRQKVGQGRAQFAAQGVLLEGREQSLAAAWEADEAADLAKEQMIIMQKVENDVWATLVSANKMEAEGYGQAAGAYGQAAELHGQAAQAWGQQALAIQQRNNAYDAYKRAKKKSKRGLGGIVGSIGGAIIGGVAAGFATGGIGTVAGAAVGSKIGGGVGGIYDAR